MYFFNQTMGIKNGCQVGIVCLGPLSFNLASGVKLTVNYLSRCGPPQPGGHLHIHGGQQLQLQHDGGVLPAGAAVLGARPRTHACLREAGARPAPAATGGFTYCLPRREAPM